MQNYAVIMHYDLHLRALPGHGLPNPSNALSQVARGKQGAGVFSHLPCIFPVIYRERRTLGGTAESTPPGWIDRNETDCPGKMARLLYAPLTRRTEAIGPPQRRRQATGGRSDSLARRGQSRLSQHRQILSIARKGDAFQGAYG